MAFGAVNIQPNDLRPRVGIGINLPLAEGTGFTSNYTTAEATRYNLINFFLTNPGERIGNPEFGGGLRNFIFSQINQQSTEFLKEDIQALVGLCRRIPSKVNIIQYNPIDCSSMKQAHQTVIDAYIAALTKARISVTYRRSRGVDIDAACGQLANKIDSK